MKARILTGVLLATMLAPSLAFAAEQGGEPAGAWLKLVFYVINFAAFVFVIFYYAGPGTSSYFKERARLIRSDLERLEAAYKEAEAMAERARARLAGLEDELKKLGEEIARETAFQVRKLREAGRAGAERVRRDAELTARALAEEGRRRVRAQLASSAASMARELIRKSFEPADQERLVEGFMERIRSEASR
jgi:F0F1-type ATP synthase membrane subunit b/b'